MPLALNYRAETPSPLCAACHNGIANQLSANDTKHRDVSCATCHQATHGMIPQCSDCHGTPHAKGMHEKFPKCGDCHGIAHDLNNNVPSASKKTPPAGKNGAAVDKTTAPAGGKRVAPAGGKK
jgi:hypothetical protein